MQKGLLGKKVGMLQIWNDEGRQISVTAVEAGPCAVLQVKTSEKDGYNAIQIGFEEVASKKLVNAEVGHQKKSFEKTKQHFRQKQEIRDYSEEKVVGDIIQCDTFVAGDIVFVQGVSKGKGFQGVVKRYNFKGGRKTHGSTFHRSPGAIGAGTDPGRVVKGKKMPGKMGNRKSTMKNLEVVKVLPEENLILIKGAVPGPRGASVYIYQH